MASQPRSLAQTQRPTTPPSRIMLPKHAITSMHAATTLEPTMLSQSYKSGHLSLDILSPVNQNGSFEFDKILKSGSVHRRVKKKGAWRPSWKPAQLVLRPNLLSIYRDDDATELRASINLSDVTAVAPVKKTNTSNVFGVFTPSKNYHFQGKSAKDSSDWVASIRSEARVEDDEYFLASPETRPGDRSDQHTTYETSDHSEAVDERGSSPEPVYEAIRARKERSRANTAQRIPSDVREYSGNEMMTSYSDFSDTAPGGSILGSLPRSTITTSKLTNKTQQSGQSTLVKPLAPASPVARPIPFRNISEISVNSVQARPSTSATNKPATNNPYPSASVDHHSVPDPSRVIRQGYLLTLRRSSGVKSWKRLWAVLRPNTLSFYKSEAEYSLVKLLEMSHVINAAEIDPISRSKQFCFQIILDDKEYRLACEGDNGEGDLEGWLGALKSCLARIRRDRALSAPEPVVHVGSIAGIGVHASPAPPIPSLPLSAIGRPMIGSDVQIDVVDDPKS